VALIALGAVQAGAQARPATLVVTGTVADSVTGAPVAIARVALAGTQLEAVTDRDGRFAIAGVPAGKHTIEVRTASLDSVSSVSERAIAVTDGMGPLRLLVPSAGHVVAAFCANRPLRPGTGVVVGNVGLSGDSVLPPGTRVVGEWQEFSVRSGERGKTIDVPTRWLESAVTADGSYQLCGVPLNTALLVRPELEKGASGNTPSLELLIAPDRLLARADLMLELPSTGTDGSATFTGIVVSDSSQMPMGGVEVALPELSKRVRTDERGGFRLAGIPPGTHRVMVRHIGHGALVASVTFAGGQTVDRRILLGRVVTLDSVRVNATPFERAMASFEENRKVGLGHFFTRAQMEKLENQTMTGILSQVLGARVLSTKFDSYVMSQRAGCPSHVYLDNLPVYRGLPGEPVFNLRTIAPDQIEAMEYYAGPSQTPMKYTGLNTHCGVLVIWTRRSP
jgi:hypothetical protein